MDDERCSTPYGIKGTIACCTVIYGRTTRCSTPYGIKGTIALDPVSLGTLHSVLNALRHQRNDRTIADRLCLLADAVLNALRHQRNDRKNSRQFKKQSNECSTPYGIKGTIAPVLPPIL